MRERIIEKKTRFWKHVNPVHLHNEKGGVCQWIVNMDECMNMNNIFSKCQSYYSNRYQLAKQFNINQLGRIKHLSISIRSINGPSYESFNGMLNVCDV